MTSRFEWRLVPTSARCTLSATMESLLTEFDATQQSAQGKRQQEADVCVADWNAVHAAIGSFADEHSTLSWRNSMFIATRVGSLAHEGQIIAVHS